MGGGVDFGETSRDATTISEEIQAELTNIRHLGCLENLFTFTVSRVTKSLQVYQCDFVDSKFYQLDQVVFAEGERKKRHFGWNFALHIWGIQS